MCISVILPFTCLPFMTSQIRKTFLITKLSICSRSFNIKAKNLLFPIKKFNRLLKIFRFKPQKPGYFAVTRLLCYSLSLAFVMVAKLVRLLADATQIIQRCRTCPPSGKCNAERLFVTFYAYRGVSFCFLFIKVFIYLFRCFIRIKNNRIFYHIE